jgi:hypothetical protein
MKQLLFVLLMLSMSISLSTCIKTAKDNHDDIVLENDQFKMVIGTDGTSRSLVFKPGNTECLIEGKKVAISTITEPRPYQNEIKLAYPNQETTFKSNSVRQEGDKLIIGYELIPWEATVSVKISPDYIGFTIEGFNLTIEDYGITMTEPPISDMLFLRLPVKNLGHYGDLLNVLWDDKVAVNILATDPFANACAEESDGYHILQAGVDKKVKLTGVGAALITCSTDQLLDKIAVVEEDFDLPHGVKSRRHKLYNASYYWSHNVTPDNVDEHIKYAKASGFRCMMIYYPAFLKTRGYRLIGNYDVWRKEYPNGKADLQAMLTKIKDAGITPGVHFLHSHIGRDSKYVTPIPDHRLNLTRIFTLAESIGKYDTTIYVEQNPANSTMAGNRRVLKIGTELISYNSYSTTRPYKFTGCVRGIDETTINAQAEGYMFGLLDVSEFGATSVYLDQNSDLQDEIADQIADIYSAGFEFMYFDGSEGVNPPFWFHVSNAQWRVFSKLKPEPIFTEGAAKTHFSWHMLTGGNAFDIFKPEVLKEETARHPFKEAPRMKDNFTRLNFGWLGYWLPDENTVGTQPDMLEYVTSRAAAWDCPVSIHANLSRFDQHPRTSDNLEVFRRWEEVRAQNWLTDDQKQMLRDGDQEHILLINEQKELELVPYTQIADVANGSKEVRAFIFEREKVLFVVYWHISGSKKLELPLNSENVSLMEELGDVLPLQSGKANILNVPVSKRRYLKVTSLDENDIITAFQNARIID